MCGGIVYNLDKIPKKELKRYFSESDIDCFEKKGEFSSFFWSRQPVLPIELEGVVKLKQWGNRDKNNKLPQTGWAKKESIDEGKWAHLKPQMVKILADQGYEKGVWFKVKKTGFSGALIKNDNAERVYMITKPADKNYLELTKYPREPIEE